MRPIHFQSIKRLIAASLSVAVFSFGIGAPRLNAMVMPLQEAAPATAALTPGEDLAKVQSVLENKVVRQRLNDLGLSDAQIQEKLAKLSDEQLHQVAMQIDEQTAAGDGGGIITILVIVILVVLLIRLID